MLCHLQRLLLLCLFASAVAVAGEMPPALVQALGTYRAEGAPHWAFMQTTLSSKGQSLVEHYDPSKPVFKQWTLLKKNGAPPSESDLKDYRDRLSRRTQGTAPNIKDQIDTSTCEPVGEDGEKASFRFRLLTTDKSDRSAAHMQAVFTLHKPTGVICRVVLSAREPFSPMFAVKIHEAETVIDYSVPDSDRPVLLQSISVRMRGRAMWFKSLDEDMTVKCTEHARAGGAANGTTSPSLQP